MLHELTQLEHNKGEIRPCIGSSGEETLAKWEQSNSINRSKVKELCTIWFSKSMIKTFR
ncbi:hypothetical protein RND71_026895 [Anisodus tanguticus]|uniref:Uncharacterized protein n=1 Tax=Anisodus tanguticus TaxID=243964 RepID=A0AAE1V8Q0_9SOLA|nr:hypothetical protein RND71_026895 [Anisodus tanguticus]